MGLRHPETCREGTNRRRCRAIYLGRERNVDVRSSERSNGTAERIPGTRAAIVPHLSRIGLWAGMVVLALAGCASSLDRIKSADVEIKHHVEKGYHADVRHTTLSTHDVWTIGPDMVDVSLMIPSG